MKYMLKTAYTRQQISCSYSLVFTRVEESYYSAYHTHTYVHPCPQFLPDPSSLVHTTFDTIIFICKKPAVSLHNLGHASPNIINTALY